MKKIFIVLLLFPLIAVSQRILVKLHPGNVDIPAGWPYQTSNILPDDFTSVVSGWSTNWTLTQLEAHRNTLQPQMDAILVAKQATEETQRNNRLQLLANLFNDFQQYEDGWQAGTNYNAATMQTILRKHNGALLLLKPMLKELYDSRQ